MAIPHHTHTFTIPTATKEDVKNGAASDLTVTPASLGKLAAKDKTAVTDIETGNEAAAGLFLDGSGRWAKPAGDMSAARKIIAGTGLAGGGDLSTDRTLSLSTASVTSLGKADTAVQPARQVTAGAGLSGGGDLSANRTIALSQDSIGKLAKADSAVQPSALGALAYKSKAAVTDIQTSNNPKEGSYLDATGAWSVPAGDQTVSWQLAHDWAVNPVGLAINDGENALDYSSYHYARKSAAKALEAEESAKRAKDAADRAEGTGGIDQDNFVKISGDTMTGELTMTKATALRLSNGGYSVGLHQNGESFSLRLSNKGTTTWNNYLPFTMSLVQGAVTFGTDVSFSKPVKIGNGIEIADINGNFRISNQSRGELFTIAPDGYTYVPGWGIRWGSSPGGIIATVDDNGNISGKIWKDVFGGPVVETKYCWASSAIKGYIDRNTITNSRVAGYHEMAVDYTPGSKNGNVIISPSGKWNHASSGHFVTGLYREPPSSTITRMAVRQPQLYIQSRGWYPLGGW